MNKLPSQEMEGHLPELVQMESIIQRAGSAIVRETIAHIPTHDRLYPISMLKMGSSKPDAPVVAFVGGIHGIERIGTQVVLAFLDTLVTRLEWDRTLHDALQQVKLVFLPLMNPVGMLRNWRSNVNGVDLMRNAPIDAEGHVPFLAGGHRLGSFLPWYRGKKGEPMELEAQALIESIQKELFSSPFSVAIDCHSGFGFKDRLWFPYAYSQTRRFPHLAEVYQLRKMLYATYPHQNYLFEPQARNYTTHGDLWDYIYGAHSCSPDANGVFLPLTLEMGSWRWVKKNPLQIRNPLGMFHPVRPHRVRRVLRHHQLLMEFIVRASRSYDTWLPAMHRTENQREAEALWYPDFN